MDRNTLDQLNSELNVPIEERPTRATDEALKFVIAAFEQLEGGQPLSSAQTAAIQRLVTDEWDYQASLSASVLSQLSEK